MTLHLEYTSRVCREALEGLYHELYFKPVHFKGLAKRSPRSMLDAAIARLADPRSFDPSSSMDLFDAALVEALGCVLHSSPDLLARWQRVESSVNARIRALFGFLGPDLTAQALLSLSPDFRPIAQLQSHRANRPLGPKRADGKVGQPDVWLRDRLASVSVEIKIRGGVSSAQYSAEQHLKYLRLAYELRRQNPFLRTYHVLLAPVASANVVSKATIWLASPPTHGSRLRTVYGGFVPCLGTKRAKELSELGGSEWLRQEEATTPTIAIDLSQFLHTSERLLQNTGRPAGVPLQLLARIREYGLGPAA